jgi:hypothetical protein
VPWAARNAEARKTGVNATVQRGLSLGLFGIFGRSRAARVRPGARSVDLHPNLVPEASLTAVKLLKEQAAGFDPAPQPYRAAAEIIGYCMIGADAFAAANEPALAAEVERRMETALDSGTSVDAKLVLLMLHARVIQPGVVEAFQLESGAEGD